MNERIQKLAEQAGFTVENGHIQSLAYKQTEKFVELIIRECVELCQESIDDGCVEAEEPLRKIKTHFGVEE
jgi:hypothetical protein